MVLRVARGDEETPNKVLPSHLTNPCAFIVMACLDGDRGRAAAAPELAESDGSCGTRRNREPLLSPWVSLVSFLVSPIGEG